MEKRFLLVAAAVLLVGCGTEVSRVDRNASALGNKVTICHATGSETNQFVAITVSANAVGAHDEHQNGEDGISGCVESAAVYCVYNSDCESQQCVEGVCAD